MVLLICWSCIPSSSFGISKWLSNAFVNSIFTPHLYTPRNLRFLHLLTQKRMAFLHPKISRGHLGNMFHEYLYRIHLVVDSNLSIKNGCLRIMGGSPNPSANQTPETERVGHFDAFLAAETSSYGWDPNAVLAWCSLVTILQMPNPPTKLASLKTNHKPKNLFSSPFLWFTWGFEVQFLHSLN